MPFTPKRKASTGLNKLACIEVRIPPARLERYNTILQSTPPIARNVEDFIAVLQDTIRQQCSEQEQLKSRIRRLEYERVKACRDSEAYYQRLLTSHEQVNKDVDELQRHHEALLREQERAAIQLSDLHSKLNASSTKSAQSEVEKTRLQKLFDAEQQVVTELRERLDQAHAAEALIQPSSTNTGSSTSPRQFTESHCTNNDTLSVAKMDLTRCVQSFESLEVNYPDTK